MSTLFAFHKLNTGGQAKARLIADQFDKLLTELTGENGLVCQFSPKGEPGKDGGRELAIVKTKLEEACFFAKKAMAVQPENQEKE